MILSKSFLVVGEVKTYNGVVVRTIAEKKDEVLNAWFKKFSGKVLNIETNVHFSGQDQALVTVVYETEEEPEKSQKFKK